MLPEVRALLILQDRDRRLLAAARDLEKIPQEEARAKTKLAGDLAAVAAAREALREAELAVKRIELDLETRRTTVQRLKQQQFETRKNDEYRAIGHEIDRYSKDIDDFETRVLEAMEAVDRCREVLRTAEAALAKTQTLVDEDLARLAERRGSIEGERDETAAERARLAAEAPEEMLPLYERLMKTKAGLALAPLDEGRCGGCHMKLIASTVIRVQAENEVTRCEDCGRILYSV